MQDATKKIDEYLTSIPAWQSAYLSEFRTLIHQEIPDITEEWKWNVPVFSLNDKTLFAMSAFKDHTKYNFIKNGAQLSDKSNLFNNGLESKKSRSIDIRQGETLDSTALSDLIRQAAKLG